MNLLPMPEVAISDADVAGVLGRAVRIIDPLLDVLWGTDPLGLKERTHRSAGDAASGALDRVRDALACVLNTADVPGTRSWDDLGLDARINWWVRRVGAVNTVAVAFPGFLGALGDRLPLQDLLGFTNQAVVLCAVAREYGVSDPQQQVRLLAAVLCERDLPDGDWASAHPDGAGQPDGGPSDGPADGPAAVKEAIPRTFSGVTRAVWKLMGLLNAVSAELAKRPHPRAPFRYLGMLPGIGAVIDYFGELGALTRSANQGRRWLAEQSAR